MRAAVLVLNTNAWRDTIECLESVLRSDHAIQTLIVCDNGSSDGSVERIVDWAEGRLNAYVPTANPLRDLSFPPVPKPLQVEVLERTEAELGRGSETGARMVVVRNGENLGFTGGNNVGLRYLKTRDDWDCVWMLNPDTVVRPDALRKLDEGLRREEGAGICGSTLLYYAAPDTVQVLGGASYNRWLALPRHIGAGQDASSPIDPHRVVRRMVYVYGASMLVSRKFIDEVGLLNEERFLYFDELDWAMRARGRFGLSYAPESVVYHREGGSLGVDSAKSWTSDYYFLRNRIQVTREFAPYALPTVYLAIIVAAVRRARRRQWDRALMATKLLWTA